jgi:hypothetical protein
MKARLLGVAGAALLITVSAAWADEIKVRVNGEPVPFRSAQPTQIAGRVMIPLRGVLEQLGAERVLWRPERQEVFVRHGTSDIRLHIGDRVALVNGRPVELDVPPMVIQETTMVPLRFVSENLGARVDWLPSTQTVYIITSGERVAGSREQLPNDRVGEERGRVVPRQDQDNTRRDQYSTRRDQYYNQSQDTHTSAPRSSRAEHQDEDAAFRSAYVAALFPRPGARVNDPRAAITVRLGPEADIDLRTVRLYVNGQDVTPDAQITPREISYVPTRDWPSGRTEVRVVFRDTRGGQANQLWDFSVR